MKKITWIYLASYLCFGGFGFAFAPEIALKLFMSSGEYGDIMPRVAGLFMLTLGSLIGTMTYNNDLRYFGFSVIARSGMVTFFAWLFSMSKDPLFIIISVIVLIGLLPSRYFFLIKSAKN